MLGTSNLLINEEPLVVLPMLAVAIGLNEAIVLQQVHYWLRKQSAHVINDRRWIYNTYEQWQEQFPFFSESTIKRIFQSLEERKIIISQQIEKSNWNRRKWYSIDYDLLETLYLSNGSNWTHRKVQSEPFNGVNLNRSNGSTRTALISETTTETTTKNTAERLDERAKAASISPADLPAKKKPAKAQTANTNDERAETPAIVLMRKMMSRYPARETWDDLIAVLGDAPDVVKLAACRKEWVSRGHNPQSIKWATDWYKLGIPESFNNNRKETKTSESTAYTVGSTKPASKPSRFKPEVVAGSDI